MLKFLFWTLLLANGLLFAYERGYFEAFASGGREPARLANQLNADKVKIVPKPNVKEAASAATSAASAAVSTPVAAAAPAASVPVASAPVAAMPAASASAIAAPATVTPPAAQPAAPPTSAASIASKQASATSSATAVPVAATEEEKKPDPAACMEIGNFNAEDAKRFTAQLQTAGLSDRVKERNVHEVVSNIVYIPPQPDREGAEKKAGELRRLGITDFYIIQDNSPMRWGISLGVFKREEAARNHLATLAEKGVRSARLGQRTVRANLTAYQFYGLDAEKKWVVEKIKASGFTRQQVRACADE